MLPGQPVADLQAEDRRAPQAAADYHPQEHLAVAGTVKIEADVMHHDRRAVLLGRADGDLELARQEQEFRVDGGPLAQDLRQGARVQVFVAGHPGKGFGGDVAHTVAGSLDGVHLHFGQALQDIRHLGQLDPVELQVLPGGEVAVAAVEVPGDAGQSTHLPGAEGAVGNRHPQHVGVLLHIQAVLQAQGQELLLAQLAAHEALDLVAKLRHPLKHQGPVIVVVLIHVPTSSKLIVL